MENLGLINTFSKKYFDKRVFITGHTGFKGSWLSLWLSELGAKVKGYSLDFPTTPNHFDLLNLSKDMDSVMADIRDQEQLNHEINIHKPDIVFHLAAQSLVRSSYTEPLETYETNIIGTANVLEACRHCESVRAVIIVTSDKCYENHNQKKGYVETDALGGHDPYSASKACAELVTGSYSSSFFEPENDLAKQKLVASVRAGNVIGGGDWSKDRLIPDLIRAAEENIDLQIRYPKSIRPWQHVLECLAGYLMLGEKLLDGKNAFTGPWNFGPEHVDEMSVEQLLKRFLMYWPKIKFSFDPELANLHETSILNLDSTKAFVKLGWKPVWNIEKAIEHTSKWYEEYLDNKNIISRIQLSQYVQEALSVGSKWT